MSILIKDMKMPTCCSDCWALDDYGDYPRCRITGGQHGYNFRYREYRMSDCPLVPTPGPPKEDVVPIVRCSECKHFKRDISCVGGTYNGCDQLEGIDGCEPCVEEDFFCAYGKRKDDGAKVDMEGEET